MNNVVKIEGFGPRRGAAEGSTSICGGWVPENQSRVAGVERRGGVSVKQLDGRPRRSHRRRR